MSLELQHISFNINGRPVVDDVSLILKPGQVVGLLGPNGAGKTTTFNLIIGLIRPTLGQVLVNGSPIANFSMPLRARMGVGYLPQEPSIFRHLTVRENLDLALAQSHTSKALCRIRREELIEDFTLHPFIDRCGYQLSGGERRRCEIARALAVGISGPKYLLLDEPFAGIDPIAVSDLQELIHSLRKRGMGILITDHNVRETLSITDYSYILNDGMILSSGPSIDVSKDPQVIRYYLGEGFRL
tara:strand:- start:200 stop:928 length:729 start_codon:yes stop_codon:yes gene_type:complete